MSSAVSEHGAQLVHEDKKEARPAAEAEEDMREKLETPKAGSGGEAEKKDEIDNLAEKIGNMSAVSEHGAQLVHEDMKEARSASEAGSGGEAEKKDEIVNLAQKIANMSAVLEHVTNGAGENEETLEVSGCGGEAEKKDGEIDNVAEEIGNMSAVTENETNEGCNMGGNEEAPDQAAGCGGEADEDDGIYYLTEDVPFFDVFFKETHVNPPWNMRIPKYALPWLPSADVPVVLRHGGKKWTVNFNGGKSRPRFDVKWRDFVVDNKIKAGDACVFEVTDRSPENTTLKVFILRGDLPPELQALVDTRGGTSESPIVMD